MIDKMVSYCRNRVRDYEDSDKAALLREVAKKLTQEADDLVLNEYFG